MTVDEYVTTLHNIARECQLDTMYDDFMLQVLLLGINDGHLRRKLFDDAGGDGGLSLEQAIKKCHIAESSQRDMAVLQGEETVKVVNRRRKISKSHASQHDQDESTRFTRPLRKTKGSCGNCGQSHPPRQCPAYGQQCHTCKKYNHYKAICRSKKQVNVVAEEESDESNESLLCLQVVRKNKKLMFIIKTCAGDSRKDITFQLDTGASCNILNYRDYCDLGKPTLVGSQSKLCQFDGSVTRALGGCNIQVFERSLYVLVHKTSNHSLLSLDASLELGLISLKEEWVNLVSDENLQDILASYEDVFEGIGCLPGEYHIEIDKRSSAKTVSQ
ncbi:uncharacterized protein [Watersipora subatra]|uniref:uncharacterized protein n=1 Tax=Watersipora subatra TaxID=2589382 RepID=UPI00355C7A9D